MAYYRSYVCESGHRNEADFDSYAKFQEAEKKGIFLCACCDSTKATIEMPRPRVNAGASRAQESAPQAQDGLRFWTGRTNTSNDFLNAGPYFAEAAREIHRAIQEGEPVPNIAGVASDQEMQALERDGIGKFGKPKQAKTYDS